MPYGISPGLSYGDLRDMENAFHVARRHRLPLNAFLTYTPPKDMDEAERPRRFSTYRGHLADALRRNDYRCIGIFVREKKADDDAHAGEHLHGLVHAADEKAFRAIQRAHADYTHVEWNDGARGDFSRLLYVQKQRTGRCEGLVKLNHRPRLQREIAAPVVGRQWSMSGDLMELVKRDTSWVGYRKNPTPQQKRKPSPTPERPKFTVVECGQIELFTSKPINRLHQYGGGLMPPAVAMEIRFHLKRLGMTQEQLARAALLGRPTITNALEGRFPLSEWAARRIRETLLPLQTAANLNAVAAA